MNTDGCGERADIESVDPIVGKHRLEAAMPIYEYRCVNCKKPFEILKTITEHKGKAVKCPKCESKKVERRWSSISVETSSKS